LVGDGETNEGQIWEAVQTAVKYELDNMVIFVDNNRIQNDGFCDEIMPVWDLREKFQAFGCEAYRINGHKMEEIVNVLDQIRGNKNKKPIIIVASTVKGKGVSFMEDEPKWHGLAPDDEEFKQALKEIEEGLN
jgi:transketolase